MSGLVDAPPADRAKPGPLRRYLPILDWLPHYQPRWLAADFAAGLSVWALLVPQGLAYATVAGVPVQYGLYTAFAVLIAYAVFGTSHQMIQGPSATVAAVSAAVITPLVGAAAIGTNAAVPDAAALALVAGVIYVLLGLLRMGWVSNFLSKAVLAGFILGFALGIIIDQSHKLLGVAKVDGSYVQVLIGTIIEVPETNLPTLALGVAALAMLLLFRRWLPRWPRALIVMALSILAVMVLDLTSQGVKVTGEVPTGLFSIGLPGADWSGATTALLAGAFSVIFVGYSESLASARMMSLEHGYPIDPDQELIAQGAACGAAGLVGGFATDGSLSKTSVADTAGQKTQMVSGGHARDPVPGDHPGDPDRCGAVPAGIDRAGVQAGDPTPRSGTSVRQLPGPHRPRGAGDDSGRARRSGGRAAVLCRRCPLPRHPQRVDPPGRGRTGPDRGGRRGRDLPDRHRRRRHRRPGRQELQARGITLALARVQPSILELWTRAGAIDALGPGRVFGTVREAVNAVTATSAGATS